MSESALDPKILAKIKKCLALATSDNPNEAATALRQAHALMSRHGVSAEAITMADIGEAAAPSRTMSRNQPAQWEASLVAAVGKAFGCKMLVQRMVPKNGRAVFNEGSFIFVGLKSQVELAAYTAQVLVRKCKKARSTWIRETLAGMSEMPGGRKRATALGDQFALGWVAQIQRLVREFAHPAQLDEAIARHVDAKTNSTEDAAVRKHGARSGVLAQLAQQAGLQAAQGEHLHRPVHTRAPAPMLNN